MKARNTLITAAVVLTLSAPVVAQDSIGEPGRGGKAPNPLNNIYFGEEHLHTVSSADAFAFGTRTTPADLKESDFERIARKAKVIVSSLGTRESPTMRVLSLLCSTRPE